MPALVSRLDEEHFRVEKLRLEAPRADEVLVRFTAAGLCHTDLEVAAGNLPTPLPVVAGHEGAGAVEQRGLHLLLDPRCTGQVELAAQGDAACAGERGWLQFHRAATVRRGRRRRSSHVCTHTSRV